MPNAVVFHSIDEVQETFFPKSILSDLETTLCAEFDYNMPYQHRLVKNENNPKTGIIEIAIPKSYTETGEKVMSVIKDFYSRRGYKAIKKAKAKVIAVGPKETYEIIIIRGETSYIIHVHEQA